LPKAKKAGIQINQMNSLAITLVLSAAFGHAFWMVSVDRFKVRRSGFTGSGFSVQGSQV
jgi:hypothetical protein